MKTAALRDATVARVKETFAKWRTFNDMPDAARSPYDIRVGFKADLSSPVNYVEALYSVCAVATPVGRIGVSEIAGLSSVEAMEAGQRIGGTVDMRIEAHNDD